jgi:hypothetical protein
VNGAQLNVFHIFFFFLYSCCSHLEHSASVKRFVSLQFLNLRQSAGLLVWGISQSQGRYLTQTKIHTFSGIRTHDFSVWAVEDISCLIPRCHCDRCPTEHISHILLAAQTETSFRNILFLKNKLRWRVSEVCRSLLCFMLFLISNDDPEGNGVKDGNH